MKVQFSSLADSLAAGESKIIEELNAVQGVAKDIGGYYQSNNELASAAMRPSATLNSTLAAL